MAAVGVAGVAVVVGVVVVVVVVSFENSVAQRGCRAVLVLLLLRARADCGAVDAAIVVVSPSRAARLEHSCCVLRKSLSFALIAGASRTTSEPLAGPTGWHHWYQRTGSV